MHIILQNKIEFLILVSFTVLFYRFSELYTEVVYFISDVRLHF